MSGGGGTPGDASDESISDEEGDVCKPNHALMQAAKSGIWAEISTQLSEGALLEQVFLDEEEVRIVNLLLVSSNHGHLECVQKLIHLGASEGLVEAILRSANRGYVDCFRYLTEVEICRKVSDADTDASGILCGLMKKVKNGDFDSVRKMVEKSSMESFVSQWGGRLMNVLITFGCPTSCVQSLMDCGINLNFECDVTCLTPIKCAIKSNNLACVRFLRMRGAEFYIDDAIFCRDDTCLEELVKWVIRKPILSYMEWVMYVDKKSSMNILLQYLDSIDSKDMCGMTLLMWACHRKSLNWAKFLLDNGASSNISSKGGETALTISCTRGDYSMVELLLKYDVDVNWQFSGPNLPLSEETQSELKLRSFWDTSTEMGCRPAGENALIASCMGGHDDILGLLLEHQANPLVTTPTGMNGLTIASVNNSPKCVEKLVAAGISVNHKEDKSGLTALMFACKHGNYQVVDALLKLGADTELRDNVGRSAAMYTLENKKDAKCLQLLRTHQEESDVPMLQPLKTCCWVS